METNEEEFLNDYLTSRNAYETTSSQNDELKAAEETAIAYAIDCAEWSVAQNRSNDISKEAEYMFVSHYIDRKEYYGKIEKETLIQNSAAIVCAYLLGGYAGAAETVLGSLKSTMIGFTVKTYTDFFNYVAWVSLQYGYSGRYALLFSDYAGI